MHRERLFLQEERKLEIILSGGNNVKQCASSPKTILKIWRSELMKPQEHWMSYKIKIILKCVNELISQGDVY